MSKDKINPFIEIDGIKIGIGHPPYVVAELSANHNGELKRALNIIDAAKNSGANAVKLQTYTPDTITLNSNRPEFQIKDGLWGGQSLYELYQKAHLPWDWHKPLFDHSRKVGITIFSSPFDMSAVDFLEDLNCPAYKIASFEIVDLALISYAARTKKPLIISTGMANLDEILEAINTARESGCNELSILHCVSSYPAPPEDYNLATIKDMADKLGVVTGLSDHTTDNTTAIASLPLGASLFEKHFTLDRSGGGPDDSFSLEPSDLYYLTKELNKAWRAIGNVSYDVKKSEIKSLKYRRSLYFVRNLKAGDIITPDCIKSIRPNNGLHPRELNRIIGKRSLKDITSGTPTSWEFIA